MGVFDKLTRFQIRKKKSGWKGAEGGGVVSKHT